MISFRPGNITAILIALMAFYCSLTGLTPQNLVVALTRSTQKVAEDTGKLVNEVVPVEESEPETVPTATEQWSTDSPPAKSYLDSPRLILHTGKSKSANPPSSEGTSSLQ
ncbi:hypothetical protein [Lusitaniella coriacea]|uniref:hypothetical protein n=1 Tax=Lusitaniella coriacea TaxID=1983105 RepID=UPI003CF8C492